MENDEPADVTAESTVVGQLDLETQRLLVKRVQELWRHAPPQRPQAIGGSYMRVTVTSWGERGWFGTGKRYAYLPRQPGGAAWPPIPAELLEIWQRFSPRPDLRPDTALCNWYDGEKENMALGRHSDTSEFDCTLPVVTISLGLPGRFKLWGPDGRATTCILHSGAVNVLAGPSRLLDHAIGGLLDEPEQMELGAVPPPPFFVPMPNPLPRDARGRPRRGRASLTMRVAGDPRAAGVPVERPPATRELTKDRMDEILAELRGQTAAIMAAGRRSA